MLLVVLMGITCAVSSTDANDTDGDSSRKVLGSSVVTSVSVIVDIGNGSKTYFSDAIGKPVPKPATGTQLASPIILLNPDRYEFYTFGDNGNLVKRLMTLDEIQGIIASGDGETPNSDLHPIVDGTPEKHVNDVVNNVQNVLKEEMEAHKNSAFNLSMLDTPNTSSNWDIILPTIFGTNAENGTPQEIAKTEANIQLTETPPAISVEQKTHDASIENDTVAVVDNKTDATTQTSIEADKNNSDSSLPLTSFTYKLETTTPLSVSETTLKQIVMPSSAPVPTTTTVPTVVDTNQNQSTTAGNPTTKEPTQETTKMEYFSKSDLNSTISTTSKLPSADTVTIYNTPPLAIENVDIVSTTPDMTSVSVNSYKTTTSSSTVVYDSTNPIKLTTTAETSTGTNSPTTASQIFTTNNTTVSENIVKPLQFDQTTLQTSTSPEPLKTTLAITTIIVNTTPNINNETDLKNRYEEADLNQTTEHLQKYDFTTVRTTDSTSNTFFTPTILEMAQDITTKTPFRLGDNSTTVIDLEETTTLLIDYNETISSSTTEALFETNTLKVSPETNTSSTSTTERETTDPTTKSTPEFINISATTTKPKTKPTEQKVVAHTQAPSTPKPDMTWTLVPTIVPPKITTVNDNKQSSTSRPVDLVPKPLQGFGLEDSTSTLDTDIYQFVELCNELAFSFWSTVTSGVSFARSVVVSPFAATSMLAMVFLGARGGTSGEMNEILKLDDMVTFNPHAMFKDVIDSIEVSKKSGVAASVFVKELYSDKSKGKLLRFYKDRVKQFYDGHVEEVDFNEISDVVRRRTNLLVKRHTWGKILEYLKDSSVVAQPPLAAISANIFQTDCSGASIEGRDGEIHFVVLPSIRQRKLIPIPAAVWRTGFLAGYDPALDATAVSIGTKEQTISTVFVIPGQQGISAPGDGLARLETRLIANAFKQGAWSRLLRSLIPRPGLEVQIPRFSHRSVINATIALQQMGLKDLFNASTADLKGLNGVPNELYLSDMIQINTFATCGEGKIEENHHSEIYPATANRPLRKIRKLHSFETADDLNVLRDPLYDTEMLELPLQLRPRQARLPEIPRLRFDRPFLYFVRHNPTGLILHIGRFNPRLLP